MLSRVIFHITYVNDLGLFKDTSDMVTGFFNFEFCSKISHFTNDDFGDMTSYNVKNPRIKLD